MKALLFFLIIVTQITSGTVTALALKNVKNLQLDVTGLDVTTCYSCITISYTSSTISTGELTLVTSEVIQRLSPSLTSDICRSCSTSFFTSSSVSKGSSTLINSTPYTYSSSTIVGTTDICHLCSTSFSTSSSVSRGSSTITTSTPYTYSSSTIVGTTDICHLCSTSFSTSSSVSRGSSTITTSTPYTYSSSTIVGTTDICHLCSTSFSTSSSVSTGFSSITSSKSYAHDSSSIAAILTCSGGCPSLYASLSISSSVSIPTYLYDTSSSLSPILTPTESKSFTITFKTIATTLIGMTSSSYSEVSSYSDFTSTATEASFSLSTASENCRSSSSFSIIFSQTIDSLSEVTTTPVTGTIVNSISVTKSQLGITLTTTYGSIQIVISFSSSLSCTSPDASCAPDFNQTQTQTLSIPLSRLTATSTTLTPSMSQGVPLTERPFKSTSNNRSSAFTTIERYTDHTASESLLTFSPFSIPIMLTTLLQSSISSSTGYVSTQNVVPSPILPGSTTPTFSSSMIHNSTSDSSPIVVPLVTKPLESMSQSTTVPIAEYSIRLSQMVTDSANEVLKTLTQQNFNTFYNSSTVMSISQYEGSGPNIGKMSSYLIIVSILFLII